MDTSTPPILDNQELNEAYKSFDINKIHKGDIIYLIDKRFLKPIYMVYLVIRRINSTDNYWFCKQQILSDESYKVVKQFYKDIDQFNPNILELIKHNPKYELERLEWIDNYHNKVWSNIRDICIDCYSYIKILKSETVKSETYINNGLLAILPKESIFSILLS